mmetsp:Transcript_35024/g.40473  ORF Transcript_35024/g.40473 Transcript_35024/m.40473 type:complete len:121 (-) Transcript_35024:29-391(-)
MVVYQQRGTRFWGHGRTPVINLLNAVDKYIRDVQRTYFFKDSSPCELREDNSEVDKFKANDPWTRYDNEKAGSSSQKQPAPAPAPAPAPEPAPAPAPAAEPAPAPKKRPSLSEPEKSVQR